ncbi:hypothetical protein BO94DRAFT_567568 [Aspergillus sclerotioniger CBS 115572]|uniref:B-related factor 1 n=1 Tax=Aspergillus sclerotioniger CBS 115572 TaxID=1450535 RepID=A0A317W108_9EURO|nr:hypothetical protein BO94DRAFT_567568 [Aspergillus sclerotioniger CBS 115572]PWY80326.1 hypothetical protein BO94DRAFT_567568 [Aspergillus sclerotioniger CBS 115572]
MVSGARFHQLHCLQCVEVASDDGSGKILAGESNEGQRRSDEAPRRPTTHPKTTTCPNPGCPAPHIVEDDGHKVCSGCGTVISEANIVSEVTFGESSSGAAVVQGTFVGEDQSHVRSYGPGFQRGGAESREITEQNGNRYINQLSRALTIPESAMKAAGQVFKLAVGLNFIQGRRTKTVAAVCLYIACRRQDGNTVMLIDFADVLMINVFKLGRTYKALLDELRLGGNVFLMNPIDPESLIYRFAKQLEFGSATMQVASEAVRIVQRMNRDWMTTGRRPAGICGAALILAARMNNFRRTVREVVYVVKVTEITISQRLNEFSSTESGELTVDQFRSVQLENAHDPPSFARAREGRKPSRSFKRRPTETAAEIEGDIQEALQPRRVDSDGFAIPNLPIDPALIAASSGQRRQSTASNTSEATSEPGEDVAKPGRNKGPKRPPLPAPSPDQIASEEALENEMTALLSKGSNMIETGVSPPRKVVSDNTEIDATEFELDPEVSNCLLSPAEVDIKERIWVHENKDYLRAQQEKALKRALAEADARPGADGRRLGDVAYLEGEGEDGDGRSTRASTPAEATRRMLERRGFSKKINYRLLESLFGEEGADEASKSKEESLSRSQSRSQSVVSRRSASIEPEAASRGAGAGLAASSTTSQPVGGPVSSAAPVRGSTEHVAQAGAPADQAGKVGQNGEVLGPADGAKNGCSDGEQEDDYEEEDDMEDDPDGVDAAFAGNYGDYYDEGSDYGSD